MVHKSLINEFLVKQLPGEIDKATLGGLIDDTESGNTAKNSFAVVLDNATLADVKEAMARQSTACGVTCEDAFILSLKDHSVVGWITNDIIEANAVPCTIDGNSR